MYNDPIRTLVDLAINERGKTKKSVSLEIGMSHSYMQQYLKRRVPETLPEEIRPSLAAALGLDVLTFGLWEVVGTPIELAAQDKLTNYVLVYGADDKIETVDVIR